MKKFNFLSNLWSLLVGSRKDDGSTRYRLVIDSFTCRLRVCPLKLVAVLAILLTIGVGNVWGASLTYTHDFTTTISSATDVTLSTITWTASGLSNVGAYNSSNYKGIQIGTGKKTGAITLTSKNNWGAQSSTSYYGYTNVKKVYVWMNAGGAGTVSATVTIGGKAATSDGTTVASNSSASSQRSGTTKVTYTPAADGKTGAIVITVSKGNASDKAGYLCAIQVECEEPSGGCANQVNITNSSTTSVSHGSFDVSMTGSQDACSALSVTVTPNPDEHYHVASVSATNPATTGTAGAAVDNGDGTYTITYSANAKGNTTISVTFAEDTKYTVTWMSNGSQHTTTQVYSGEKPTFPSNPSSCDGTSTAFYGWATATWTGKLDDVSAKTIYLSGDAMPAVTGAVTYHAVFAKETPGSSYELVTSLSGLGNRDAYLGSYISYSGTRYYAGTSASALQNASTSGTPPTLSSTTGLQKVTFTSTGTANQYYIKNSSGNYLYSNTTNANPSFSATTCAWTFSDVDGNGRFKMISSLGSDVHLRAYATSTSAATFKTYGTTTNYGICVFMLSVSYSEYLTTCCTPLGQINGSVTWSSGPVATLIWDKDANASNYVVKWKTHAGGEGTYSTTNVSDIDDYATNKKKCSVTGLTAGTDYDFKIFITGKTTPSVYCDKDTVMTSTAIPVTVLKQDETGATISDAGVTATASGRTLTASAGSTNYLFKGWKYDTGADAGTTIDDDTSENTTLNGTPTGDVTVIAEFYKPRVIEWKVNNVAYTPGSPGSATVKYNSEWSELTLPTDPDVGDYCGQIFVGWTTTDMGESSYDKTADAADISALVLMTNDNKSDITTKITEATRTFHAVFADYAD